jgi:hypothetical protein
VDQFGSQLIPSFYQLLRNQVRIIITTITITSAV